jgi:hypothetical protein
MRHRYALLAAALLLVALSSARASEQDNEGDLAPGYGTLTDIPGPGGCVAQENLSAGRENHVPKDDDCAAAPGLRQVHHVALSADERFLYAVAGIWRLPEDDGALTIYRRNVETGEFQRLPGKDGCIKRANPALGPEGCGSSQRLSAIRFAAASSDNRFLYVTGLQGIAIFRRIETGTLEEVPGPAGCISNIIPDCTRVPVANEIEDITFSRDGLFAYAASLRHVLLSFYRNPDTGTLSLQECIGDEDKACTRTYGRLQNARGLTLSPDERFLYVASVDESVSIFARDPVQGTLTQLPGDGGCLSTAQRPGCRQTRALHGPHRLTITRDGRFAYLASKRGSEKSSSVAIFHRDIKTGELMLFDGPAGCITEDGNDGCRVGRVIGGAHAIAFDANERTAYLSSDRGEGGIAIFRRDPETGTLEQLSGALGCFSPINWKGCRTARRTGGLHFMTVTRDGRFAYAAGENSFSVLGYRINLR